MYYKTRNHYSAMVTFSAPKEGLEVIWESVTRSEYTDLLPLLDGIEPELKAAIAVSLPSESYLKPKWQTCKYE
jgi:hypothetical protein